jgi:hypothetical protein
MAKKLKTDGLGNDSQEMAASYVVNIVGIERTRLELARLSNAIESLNTVNYGAGPGGVTVASQPTKSGLKSSDIIVSVIDTLEGRVQTKAVAAVRKGVALGRKLQVARLNAATTATGIARMAGKSKRRRAAATAGRNETGAMIAALGSNVELFKGVNFTTIVGWHGWPIGRQRYFVAQEKGTSRIAAARSLGFGIIGAREEIKRELRDI